MHAQSLAHEQRALSLNPRTDLSSVAVGAPITVHVPLDALRAAGTTTATGDVATIIGAGLPADEIVDANALARLCCDAPLITRIITDPLSGRCLDQLCYQRTPSAALKRAVLARDRHRCTFPGCARTANLHLHHIVHWVNGGLSTYSNLTALCPRHHHAIHDGDWTLRREPTGALTWISPTGRPVPHPWGAA